MDIVYNPMKQTWINPNIQYLFNQTIVEYDMKDAGFSIIKEYGLLPKPKIMELERIKKGRERHIAIGILERDDKSFSKALSEKFAEVRKIFISMNQLTNNDIISVKKDAIFTIGECERSNFGAVIFAPKNQYTSYIRFPDVQDLEIYYGEQSVDVKGMGDSAINRHRLYMLDFLSKTISMTESKSPKIKRYIDEFLAEYKWHRLEDQYYLEFNRRSANMDPIFNYQNVIVPIVQIVLKEIR